MSGWETDVFDKEALESIKSILPPKIIDIHAHIYKVEDIGVVRPHFLADTYEEVGYDVWRSNMCDIFTSTPCGALFMPMPTLTCDIKAENEYLSAEIAKGKSEGGKYYKGLMMVSPDMSQDYVMQYLDNFDIIGFKPYYFFSRNSPKNESSIKDYIPEWFFKIANERGMLITLHLVKHKALSDPDNYKSIVRLCRKYPNMKLILAHAARGFHSPNTVEAIKKLRGLRNVYFDTALICEPDPLKAILDEFGTKRLMWGSDFPASVMRGKYCTVGDSFVMIDSEMIRKRKDTPAGINIELIQAGIESLRAVKSTVDGCGLDKEETEDIFFNNALEVMGYF